MSGIVSVEPPPPRRSRAARIEVLVGTLVLVAGIGAACTKREPVDPAVTRGFQVYSSTCIACHHMDPALPGAIGPELRGVSREVLEAKVLRGTYPPGYAPKRTTQAMPPQPQLAGSIDDLAAFLR